MNIEELKAHLKNIQLRSVSGQDSPLIEGPLWVADPKPYTPPAPPVIDFPAISGDKASTTSNLLQGKQ